MSAQGSVAGASVDPDDGVCSTCLLPSSVSDMVNASSSIVAKPDNPVGQRGNSLLKTFLIARTLGQLRERETPPSAHLIP